MVLRLDDYSGVLQENPAKSNLYPYATWRGAQEIFREIFVFSQEPPAQGGLERRKERGAISSSGQYAARPQALRGCTGIQRSLAQRRKGAKKSMEILLLCVFAALRDTNHRTFGTLSERL